MTEETTPLLVADAGHSKRFLKKEDLAALVDALHRDGYTVIAPRLDADVVRLQPVETAAEIARGFRDETAPGHYRLRSGEPSMYFESVVGPDSPKRSLFPPQQLLVTLSARGEQFVMEDGAPDPPKLAFLGIRACDLAAIAVQDRVFGVGADQSVFRCESESYYRQCRSQALFIAANCTRPASTCFCHSMNTGPVATAGFDLALTELKTGFLIDVGTERGAAIAARLPVRPATETEVELAELKVNQARECMSDRPVADCRAALQSSAIEHAHWDVVAQRCLGCGNCTQVCPTCFCSTVVESNDLATGHYSRHRLWASCFTDQFTYTTSGPVRSTIRGRYRHWLRHKFCTWWEQFGVSGCTGCGRCITWCPARIDVREELAQIQVRPHAQLAAAPQPAPATKGGRR